MSKCSFLACFLNQAYVVGEQGICDELSAAGKSVVCRSPLQLTTLVHCKPVEYNADLTACIVTYYCSLSPLWVSAGIATVGGPADNGKAWEWGTTSAKGAASEGAPSLKLDPEVR